MIMQAGSGHIGTSFSSMDLITWLWTEELVKPNSGEPGADTYFSSKGHDAPALYSLLIALGKLDFDLLHRLRRLGGLPGHPDVGTPFIAANTGSLGMGISKAYGMLRGRRQVGKAGRVVLMTGDGELQEGQIWESLQPIANERLGDLIALVDHNKYQSDATVASVSDLGRIDDKFRAFGWEVRRADGHDFRAIRDAFAHFASVTDRPKVLIADTIKGKGVSFMEGLSCGDETYQFHAGAPSLENYLAAVSELTARINGRLATLGRAALTFASAPQPVRTPPSTPERLVVAYGDELVKIAAGAPGDRGARRRSPVRLRHRGIQGAVPRSVHRMRHRGTAHGVGGGGDGARRIAARRPLVCLFSLDASERADLQQRDRTLEDHLYGDARRGRSGRPRPFASIGSRYLGDRLGAGACRDRAVLRARSAPRHPVGYRGERRQHVPALRERADGSAVRAAAVIRVAGRLRRDAPGRARHRAHRVRSAPDGQRVARRRPGRAGRHQRGRHQPSVAQSHR